VRLHPRTIQRPGSDEPVLASSEPSQRDYERLRSAVVEHGRLPEDLAAAVSLGGAWPA